MDGLRKLVDAIRKAKRVYLMGNGGSAANAIHIANDLVSCGIKAHALTADVATLTAIANDYSYEEVFERQLMVFGEKGDLLIALSGSGESPNILRALAAGQQFGMRTCAIFGDYNAACHDGDYLDDLYLLAGDDMQQAEEEQLRIGHEIMRCLKRS